MTTIPLESGAVTPIWAGVPVIAGGVVSRTVTLKVTRPVFPLLSLAEQVTVLAPIGKVDPEFGVQVTGRLPLTRSVAVGLV